MDRGKGDGRSPFGVKWLMQSGVLIASYWVTQGNYTRDEIYRWECSSPVRPLLPLDVSL